MIEQQMQLHRSFRAPVQRPVEDRSTEFDQRGVQREQFVFETEAVRAGHFAAAREQLIEHAAIELPGTVFIGVGQRGALRRVGQPQMPELAFAGSQAATNLAQGLRAAQMAEQHGHKLAPTTEPAGVALGFVLADCGLKLDSRKQLQPLTENAAYSIHGGGLASVMGFSLEPISP